MKRVLFVAAIAAIAVPALAADVGVSVQIGQPGFYGSIDIGGFPRPELVYPQPVVIQRVPVGDPVYLVVPLGHAQDWGKHCRKYNACAQPVYFVQNGWYDQEYAPRYRQRHGERSGYDRGKHDGKGRGHGHGDDDDDD